MDQSYIQIGVACAVVYVVGSWAYRQATAPASTSQPRPRREVPQEQVDAVLAAFPQVTANQARWDLGRSGSVEITVNKILRDGRLPDVSSLSFAQNQADVCALLAASRPLPRHTINHSCTF